MDLPTMSNTELEQQRRQITNELDRRQATQRGDLGAGEARARNYLGTTGSPGDSIQSCATRAAAYITNR